jgi:hypothetical protein
MSNYATHLMAGGLWLQGSSTYPGPADPPGLPPSLFTRLLATDMTATIADDPGHTGRHLVTVSRGDVTETFSTILGERLSLDGSVLLTNGFWVTAWGRPANGTYDFHCDPGGSWSPWAPRT